MVFLSSAALNKISRSLWVDSSPSSYFLVPLQQLVSLQEVLVFQLLLKLLVLLLQVALLQLPHGCLSSFKTHTHTNDHVLMSHNYEFANMHMHVSRWRAEWWKQTDTSWNTSSQTECLCSRLCVTQCSTTVTLGFSRDWMKKLKKEMFFTLLLVSCLSVMKVKLETRNLDKILGNLSHRAVCLDEFADTVPSAVLSGNQRSFTFPLTSL